MPFLTEEEQQQIKDLGLKNTKINIVNSDGKVVGEVPRGTNGIIGTGQRVYRSTDSSGNPTFIAATQTKSKDAYGKLFEQLDNEVTVQAPKVVISDGKVSISAPSKFFKSPVSAQLKTELQTLKGADLESQEIKNAIEKLNEEIRKNYSESFVEQTIGWTPEQYADYNFTLQTVSTSNPLKSNNYLKGREKDGKIVSKTPQEWVNYYREAFNTDKRAKAFYEALASTDPYSRTMALVMGQGGTKPVYGFDDGERAVQAGRAVWNQLKQFPEGVFKLLTADNDTKRIYSLNNKLKIPTDALISSDITNSSQFEKTKEEIRDKNWDKLTDKQKAFVLEVGVSKEDVALNESQREFLSALRNPSGYKGNPLENMASADEETSKEAINEILADSSYEKYKTVNTNYSTWAGYDTENAKLGELLAKNAAWSGNAQQLGNFVGVLGRFLWENAVVQGLTGGISAKSLANPKLVAGEEAGGFSMNTISETLGKKIMKSMAKHDILPASTSGQRLMGFLANLAMTIPEDIVQTAADNVLTYNQEENKKLLNGEEISENFKRNLVWMATINALKAGWNSVKVARAAKRAARQADLNAPLDVDGLVSDADDLVRAAEQGQNFGTKDGKVTIIDENGNEKTLENITPKEAEMAQMSLFDQQSNVSEDPLDVFDKKPSTGEQKLMMDESSDDAPTGYSSTADYYRRAKNETLDFVYMTPDEYLEALLEKNGGPYEDIEAIYRRSRERTPEHTGWRDYLDDMRNKNFDTESGEGKFPPPYLIYGADGLDSQEGIHRAIAARELGVEKMPVSVQHPYNGNPEIVDEILDGKVKVETDVETAPASATRGLGETNIPEIDVDDISRASEEETPRTMVEVDSPDGPVRVEVPDYRPRNLNEAIEIEVEPTPAGVKYAHKVQVDTAMNDFQKYLNEFHDKFGDVRVSDFDWVNYKTSQGLTPDEIIGTVDPTTGRTVTQNMIDAMKWWSKQPFVKDLRMASRSALGEAGDYDKLGYLPHTTYDPANESFEEALNGALWKKSSGATVTNDDGSYKGFGGTFEDRYRTFVSNMLWDAKADAVATAKLVEEAMMEGRELTPELVEQSKRAIEGKKKIQSDVDNAPTTKELNEALSSDSEYDKSQWDEITDAIEEDAPKMGLGQAIHDNLEEIYPLSNTQKVSSQLSSTKAAFDTTGDSMRKIVIGNGLSMYDGGGADIVYSTQNAIEMVGRWAREGGSWSDLRKMIVDYEISHSGRPQKYAEKIADKWMGKIAEEPGPVTKAKIIKSLGSSMYWEGRTRLNRWLAISDYSQFNSTTRAFIDRFLFRHMQMDSVNNNPTIGQKLSKFMDGLTSYRYRALFYGNIRNALLQLSELNRLFTTFKWGDVAKTIKRLATDEDFRARVDTYVDAVAPMTDRLKAELYQQYSNVAEKMDVTQDGVTFREMGKAATDAADKIGLAPINAAEALKNRAIVAALVQEADSLGLSGDEALRHIRSRFERVALAQNEMGQIGLASSPIAKPMLFLQNFQIRELGMHWYNIKDLTGMEKSVPKKLIKGFKYGAKVLGTKFATALILTRLGYSASQAMGLDPFGLLDNYDSLDEEDMEWQDYFFKSPLFAGGLTSLISDMYFKARKAYEDSHQQTISEEAEQKLGNSWGLDVPENLREWPGAVYDILMGGVESFGPGSTLAKRIGQMNNMMDQGWAVSSTGNRMYSAPNDTLNTILGYLFGRSATANAQQYNQTLGNDLWQTLGRFNPFRKYNDFDPIDTQNYADWFKGDENDLQQFNKGRYWFQNERDKILDEYQNAIGKSYATDEDIAEAKNSMNRKLEELYDKLERFVTAYEKKNGTITSAMTKQLLNILNTGRKVAGDTPEQAEERRWAELDKALERYSALGLSPVGTYTGPSNLSPDQETKYQGSPQYRAAVSGYYDVADEAVSVLKLADSQLKPVRESIKQRLSDAYTISDWDTVKDIQKDYLKAFDDVVSPIIALYGNNILSNTNVEDQLRDMLSTGTNTRSGNLIPSEQYGKNKYGRYQSMPYQDVDVGAWAKQRFRSDIYKKPTSRSDSTVQEDLTEIKKLSSQGKTDMARARALQLKARVDSQARALSKTDYDWLNNFLKQGEK